MTSQLSAATYTFASSLGLTQTGWDWSSDYGGSAKSNTSYSGGTNPNLYRWLCSSFSGFLCPDVSADIPITASMSVGVFTAATSTSNPGGGYGLYAGVFDGPAGSAHKVVRMWMEFNRQADVSGQFRVSAPHANKVVESRLDKTSGSVTLRLVVTADGQVRLFVDGVQVAAKDWAATWNAAPLTSWANNGGSTNYSGAWASQANQYVSELRVKYPSPTTRGFPSDSVKFASTFTGADYSSWNPASGNSVNVQPPLENPGIQSSGFGILSNRLNILAVWPGYQVPGNDLDNLQPNYTGRAYIFLWQHYAGAYVFSINYQNLYLTRVRVNSNETGTTYALQIGGSDLKGDSASSTIWGTSYGSGTTIASGQYLRILLYPQYNNAVGGVAPITSSMMLQIQEFNGSTWVTRISSTDPAAGGGMYSSAWPSAAKFGYAPPSTSGYGQAQISYYGVTWGPMTDTSYGGQTGFQCYAFPYVSGSSTAHDVADQYIWSDIGYRGAMRLTDKVTD